MTPARPGASRTASCSTTAKEWLAARAAHPRFPEFEAEHHNHTTDDAGEQVLRQPRDGLTTGG